MPGILIVHASLGTGHASAAAALSEAFRRHERDAVVVDVLDYANPIMRAALNQYFKQTSQRTPQLYKLLYDQSDTTDVEEAFSGNRLLTSLERPFLSQFEQLVADLRPEAVISVHPVPGHILAHNKQIGTLPQPLYVVITDYMAHSSWLVPDVDRYFVPSEFTRRGLMLRGVPDARIGVTGIPVGLEITEPKEPAALRERYQLPRDRPVITLFGGGIDAERVRLMVTQMLDGGTPGVLVVVAGRNEQLEAALADLGDGPFMGLRRYGKVDHVDDLIAASDLVISKAGGLIVSEVMARGTPMVIIDPVPGQEEWNADVVAGAGAGIQLRMPETVPAAALYLLSQPERLALMGRQARLIGRPQAALDIAESVLSAMGVASRSLEA
ncbi:MAG: UDP-N-acetylglucosamine--LPS N-acetylglucosamine transferase [Chloroflexales bacterium]|nr:UDP-N-acetylglucosamine--LPS N-acetylglucosamine transferase [Chloroflexales bacterium]